MTHPEHEVADTSATENNPTEILHNNPSLEVMQAVAALHQRAEKQVTPHQRLIERATLYLGRPQFLFTVVGLSAAWVGMNVALAALGRPQPDPWPCPVLQGLVSYTALLLTIMILTAENRQAKLTERRAQLDLQINLLSEQKIAKLIALVEELRRDLPQVANRHDPQAEAMQESTDAEASLVALEFLMDNIEENLGEDATSVSTAV